MAVDTVCPTRGKVRGFWDRVNLYTPTQFCLLITSSQLTALTEHWMWFMNGDISLKHLRENGFFKQEFCEVRYPLDMPVVTLWRVDTNWCDSLELTWFFRRLQHLPDNVRKTHLWPAKNVASDDLTCLQDCPKLFLWMWSQEILGPGSREHYFLHNLFVFEWSKTTRKQRQAEVLLQTHSCK